MKTAKKARRHQNTRPKHKQTKDYLKHYYPFLPVLASIGLLLAVVLSPLQRTNQGVLASTTNIGRSSLLAATNSERQKARVTTLSPNEQLNAAAQAKAEDMVTRDYWSHQTPDKKEPWVFIANTDYDYVKAGENLAYGFDSSAQTIKGWMTSDTHRKNMLDPEYEEVGFGFANSKNFNDSGPATVIVAMYAKPANQAGLLASTTPNNNLGTSQNVTNAGVMLRSSWATLFVTFLAIGITAYLGITHTKTIKRYIKKGEKMIIRHPLLDTAAISLLTLSIVLLRTAGSIH